MFFNLSGLDIETIVEQRDDSGKESLEVQNVNRLKFKK